MARIYMERLIKTVIELSHGNDWDTAVVEWEIIDCEEDSTLSESCICGKEHLFYLFTIKNIICSITPFLEDNKHELRRRQIVIKF